MGGLKRATGFVTRGPEDQRRGPGSDGAGLQAGRGPRFRPQSAGRARTAGHHRGPGAGVFEERSVNAVAGRFFADLVRVDGPESAGPGEAPTFNVQHPKKNQISTSNGRILALPPDREAVSARS